MNNKRLTKDEWFALQKELNEKYNVGVRLIFFTEGIVEAVLERSCYRGKELRDIAVICDKNNVSLSLSNGELRLDENDKVWAETK